MFRESFFSEKKNCTKLGILNEYKTLYRKIVIRAEMCNLIQNAFIPSTLRKCKPHKFQNNIIIVSLFAITRPRSYLWKF